MSGLIGIPGGSAGLAEADARAGSAGALLAELRSSLAPGAVAARYLDVVRGELRERHFAGASGTEVVAGFTAAMDRLLRALYIHAEAEHGRRFPRLKQRLAIIARGGYGRAELNPYSDIDLLFLHDWKPGLFVEIVAEIILHALWDAGLTVGHVMRNVRECVRRSAGDLKEKTAILDARPLIGDQTLHAELEKSFTAEVLGRNRQKFFSAKLAESRERHEHYGDSIYLLEPQLKEGEGGLRDLHTAMWLAKVKYQVHSLEELMRRAIITERELEEVLAARDFLWRVRNSLHFLSGRHADQLTFEYQERIAPLMGYGGRQGLSGSAMLMRDYYGHANTIHMFAEGLIARVTEEPEAGRFFRKNPSRQIRPGVLIQGRILSIAQAGFFEKDPINLITIFADCQAHEAGLSGTAYQMVRDNLHLIGAGFRNDPRAGAALRTILKGRARVSETLESMHRAGVLGALIPEFGNLYARVLHDLYHIYTVDRHSLVAARELERLRNGDFKAASPLLTEVAREFDAIPLVLLALLLHDVGKGAGHDHDELGARLTLGICKRLGLDDEETDLVVFLVRNHLLMSQVAQKGDVEDDKIVSDFARKVGSTDRLKALYLLTFADMRAVAPNVYNNWRDMLLGDLYMRAIRFLEHGEHEAAAPARHAALARAAVKNRLLGSDLPADAVDEFLERMPDRYFLIAAEDDIALHFDLIRSLWNRPLASVHRHFPEREFSELIIATRDQPGLFSKVAGVLAANGMNILSARITTSADAIALDIFRISHLHGAAAIVMDEERWRQVERDLELVISGEIEADVLVARAYHPLSAGRKFVRRLPTEITIDNDISGQYTVVDVFTQDRAGLLFAITSTLYRLGMTVHFARISTNADQALDVFYVSDKSGGKITAPEITRKLSETLRANLAAAESGRDGAPD